MKRLATGLQLRILRGVALAAFAFSVLAGTLAYQLGYHRSSDAARQTLEDLVTAVEKTAAVAAYTRDALLLREVADGLARNALVADVEVRGTSGESLLAPRANPSASGAATVLTVTRPLRSPFDAKDTVGLLVLRADMQQLENSARSQAGWLAAGMVAQTLLVVLVLYLAAARHVSRPIVRLARELRGMQPGTSQRLQPPSTEAADEIGTLVRSANALLQANEQALQRERSLRAEIEAMEAQYRQIFDSTSAGIFVLDAEGRLINGNPTVLKVVGSAVADMRELRGQDFLATVFARPERARQMVAEAMRRGETVSADLELKQPGGGSRWVHCLISVQAAPRPDQPRLVEGVMYDITDRKRTEHDVRHRAEHDALTGLKNRQACDATIERFASEALAEGGEAAVLYIDLDGFKQVNDRHGHKAGDRVLVECARRLRAAVKRQSDLVGRLGGDEFVIALQHSSADSDMVRDLARTLVSSLAQPIDLGRGLQVCIGASIGIAGCPRHGATARSLLHAADEAMYGVKRQGKNGHAVANGPGAESQPAELFG
jgi:diguanylate cyclase (GGDEF)-like protein/PAS domain S-box-containing protein